MDESTNGIKQFFEEFNRSKCEDNVHHRSNILSSFSMKPEDVKVEVLDWCLHYLEQKKCPHSLALTLAKLVAHQLSDSVYEMSLQADEGIDDDDKSFSYKTSQLYIEMIECLEETCKNWQEYIDITTAKLEPLPHIVSVCAIKNGRRKMEDRHVILHNLNTVCGLKDVPHHSYYAIFDGHAGVEAASYCAAHLHWNIINHPNFLTDTEKAISEAITLTDKAFLERSYREGIKGGCTALCCLIREKTLYIAWLGDSQAILVKKGIPNVIGLPHTPDREEERCRVTESGGCVLLMDSIWRVDGTLSVSRAVGDLEHKPHISSEAEIYKIALDGMEDYIVLACDGLWDKLLPDDLGLLIYQHVNEGKTVEKTAQKLVQVSKDLGSHDNITAIVVFLKDPYNISAPPICLPSLNNKPENVQLNATNDESYSLKSQELITDLSDISNKVISSIDLSTKNDAESRTKDECVISNYSNEEYNSLLYNNNPLSSLNDNSLINGNFLQNENEKNVCENNNEISVGSLKMTADSLHDDAINAVSPLSYDSLLSTDEKFDFSDSKQTPTDISTFSDELKADSKLYLSDLEFETSVSINENLNASFLQDNISSSKQDANLIGLEMPNVMQLPHNVTNATQFNKDVFCSEITDVKTPNNVLLSEIKVISPDIKDADNLMHFENNNCALDSALNVPNTQEISLNNPDQPDISLKNNLTIEVEFSSTSANDCSKSETCAQDSILKVLQENNTEHSNLIDKSETSIFQELNETSFESANKIVNGKHNTEDPRQNCLESISTTDTTKNDNLEPKIEKIQHKNNNIIKTMQFKNTKSVTDSKISKESVTKAKMNKVSAEKLKTTPAKLQQIKIKQKVINKSPEDKPLQPPIKDLPAKKLTMQNRTTAENVFERLSTCKSPPNIKTTTKEERKCSSSSSKISETKSSTNSKLGKPVSNTSKESCASSASKSYARPTKTSISKISPLRASKSETVNTNQEKVDSAQKTKIKTLLVAGKKCSGENTTETKSLIKDASKTNNKEVNDKVSKQNNSSKVNFLKSSVKSEKHVNQKPTEKTVKNTSAIKKSPISPARKNKTVNSSATASKETEKKETKKTDVEKNNPTPTKDKQSVDKPTEVLIKSN